MVLLQQVTWSGFGIIRATTQIPRVWLGWRHSNHHTCALSLDHLTKRYPCSRARIRLGLKLEMLLGHRDEAILPGKPVLLVCKRFGNKDLMGRGYLWDWVLLQCHWCFYPTLYVRFRGTTFSERSIWSYKAYGSEWVPALFGVVTVSLSM
jgi:hypothetical protein